MLIDFRPHARLRGKQPLDVAACTAPVLSALANEPVDLDRMRMVCDWVQYRENFRDVVDLRPILATPDGDAPEGEGQEGLEVAVDVRRSGAPETAERAEALLRGQGAGLPLEQWGPGRASCIWDFNARYWNSLEQWEKSTGRGYEQALPGGQSDARNRDAVRDLIRELFAGWDRLVARGALPAELYVVELGVGNGSQARTFLDEFRDLDQARGTDFYRRLHYLMCDYSQHVLDLAREAVAAHSGHVSSFALDATRPCTALGFLRGKVFLVYVSNVYDNLPTDELAQLGGQIHQVQTRACLPAERAAELAAAVGAEPDELPVLVDKLLRLGPGLLAEAAPARFPDEPAAVAFWRNVWSAVRLAERYVPMPGLDRYPPAPGVDGELLRPLLESGTDVRMHVSNGALASFTDSLTLLHPLGRLICHDLFVTDTNGYRTGFRGPGKYDGSVVNWVNGPLLAHAARRAGYVIRFDRFAHHSGSRIITMSAERGD